MGTSALRTTPSGCGGTLETGVVVVVAVTSGGALVLVKVGSAVGVTEGVGRGVRVEVAGTAVLVAVDVPVGESVLVEVGAAS